MDIDSRLSEAYDELSLLTPRQRLHALAELEREQRFPPASLTELRDYFRIGHDRRDVVGLVGRQVGRYRVLDVLAQGRSSTVYLVETLGGARQCALKMLLPEAGAELAAVFASEAPKLERIQAPGIARLLDHGNHVAPDGSVRPFLVTEIVFGQTLDAHVERRRPPLDECIALVATVAETLATVYLQHALVHLDVKPGNILVNSLDRQPRLVDFGIGRFVAAGGVNTPVALTPSYASPEQLMPRTFGITGSHSDQYSLALVLRTLLGAPPPSCADRVEGTAWVRQGLKAFELAAIRSVLERALEPNAALRYPDLSAFARALRDQAAGLPGHRRGVTLLRGLGSFLASVGLLFAGELTTRPLRAQLADPDEAFVAGASVPVSRPATGVAARPRAVSNAAETLPLAPVAPATAFRLAAEPPRALSPAPALARKRSSGPSAPEPAPAKAKGGVPPSSEGALSSFQRKILKRQAAAKVALQGSSASKATSPSPLLRVLGN